MESKKNPELDNERVKIPLVFLGFFIVGSMISLAFTYETPSQLSGLERDDRGKSEIPIELVVVEQPEIEEPVVQVITPPIQTPPPTEIIVEKPNVDKDEILVVDVDPIIVEPDPEPVVEAPIPDFVDFEAEFPGGIPAMFTYIGDNTVYPEEAIQVGDQGKVYVQFVVETDGSITQVKIARGVTAELDREAKRVVRSMPKWKPAVLRGEKVRSYMRVPINFVLQP